VGVADQNELVIGYMCRRWAWLSGTS